MTKPWRDREPEPKSEPGRLVAGLQPVREAVRAHRAALFRICIEKGENPRLDALARFASDQGKAAERLPRRDLDRLSGGARHQGALCWAPELELVSFEALCQRPDLLGVALDGIQDPQNFGAVVRSAHALGGAAIIWPEHASAPLTPATFRASAGAIEHATLCRVAALHGALREARGFGVQVIGLDAHAQTSLRDLDLRRPTVLVIGSEHEGMKRATRRDCDTLAQLAPLSSLDSLNASVAAGIALYEAAIQRLKTDS
jgi:23S rRNA (guanosine2251-2'-O)-methyltransferase